MKLINVDGNLINTSLIESVKVVPFHHTSRMLGSTTDAFGGIVDNAVIEGKLSCQITTASGATYLIGDKKEFSVTVSCDEAEYKRTENFRRSDQLRYLANKAKVGPMLSKEAESLLTDVMTEIGIN